MSAEHPLAAKSSRRTARLRDGAGATTGGCGFLSVIQRSEGAGRSHHSTARSARMIPHMGARLGATLFLLSLSISCTRAPEAAYDPDLLREIDGIRAIDNHAHPARVTAAGEQPDRDFDALPVDNMEAQS